MNKDFCCEKMVYSVEKLVIDYDPLFRDYGITYDIGINDNGRFMVLKFCPWCSKKIPKPLNEEYFDILEKEYGIMLPDLENFTNVPKEFQSDAWWKKRGL